MFPPLDIEEAQRALRAHRPINRQARMGLLICGAFMMLGPAAIEWYLTPAAAPISVLHIGQAELAVCDLKVSNDGSVTKVRYQLEGKPVTVLTRKTVSYNPIAQDDSRKGVKCRQ
jgi:hypothetical protein